ncbi:MAG: glutamine-hydrolyzing GMP synthase, partial [Candidatus Bipolaricaulota bacterium]
AFSVYDEGAPECSEEVLELACPVLGICYGHQLLAQLVGGEVSPGESAEYGNTDLTIRRHNHLLSGLEETETVWMNHKDTVLSMPDRFSILATTDHSPVAVFADPGRDLYGVQFHPEVSHTDKGKKVLENFAVSICGANPSWDPRVAGEEMVAEAEEALKGRRAVIGLSGGVDSSTAAAITSRAIGDRLHAVYVDTGLMRRGDTRFIQETFSGSSLNLHIVDASDRFFKALKGVSDPEEKRKAVGATFIDVFDEVAREVQADVLIQGTIYSDRIESGITEHSATIKSHHNVGGLPEEMDLEVYEPLRNLYKDEVRQVAEEFGLPEVTRTRHVFPGPGLAIRIVGEVTPEKAEIVRSASYIVEDELRNEGLYTDFWMAFAVLLSIRSVGIQGDARSYKYPIVVRVIESEDAMTANFARLPYDLLQRISTRITNEIQEVNRVAYDISNKPPSTMEWE